MLSNDRRQIARIAQFSQADGLGMRTSFTRSLEPLGGQHEYGRVERSPPFGTYLGGGDALALPSERGFKCLSKNAWTAARIMSVLNSGLPCPAPAIL